MSTRRFGHVKARTRITMVELHILAEVICARVRVRGQATCARNVVATEHAGTAGKRCDPEHSPEYLIGLG
jgi:hypothetical protein